MNMPIFKMAIEKAYNMDAYITIGGGEPTMHPHFERMLMMAIARLGCNHIFIITNGGFTERARMLAQLAKHGVIEAELSQDEYHDPIDHEIVELFQELPQRGIRNTSLSYGGEKRDPLPHGRARQLLGIADDDDYDYDIYGRDCPCDTTFIMPSGDVRVCGCVDSPLIGNVQNSIDFYGNMCYNSLEFREHCEENNCMELLGG